MVVVAVKPHIVSQVLDEIAPEVTSDTLIVSVAAGVTLDKLQQVSNGEEIIENAFFGSRQKKTKTEGRSKKITRV